MNVKAILTCVSSALFFFYVIASMSMLNTLASSVMEFYHLSLSGLGILSSGYLYANALWLIPAGIIFDRFSTRKIMLFSMLLSILGTYGMYISHYPLIGFTARCLSGTASAFVLLGTIRTGVSWFSGSKVGLSIGLMIAFGMSGGYFAGLLTTLFGTPNMHILNTFAWIGIGILVFMILFYRDNPKNILMNNNVNLIESFKLAISLKQNWTLSLYISLMNLPVFVLGSLFGTTYLMDKYNLSNALASEISGMMFIGIMIASPIYGYLSDYFKNRKIPLYVGSVLSILVILLLIFMSNLQLYQLHLAFFLLGVGVIAQVIIYPIVAEINPPHIISTAQGLVSTVNNLFGAIMQIIFGYMLTFISSTNAHINVNQINKVMLIFPICFVLALIIINFIRETYATPLNA